MGHENEVPSFPYPIAVVGVGGGGCNTVNRLIEIGFNNEKLINFIAVNTDKSGLEKSLAPIKIMIGPKVTKGMSARTILLGQRAAEESSEEIYEALKGIDIVIITAGLGGGSGTGAAPIIAQIAKELGALTISIVTLPFSFEVGSRHTNAHKGIQLLQQYSDTLITIPNDQILSIAPKDLTLDIAFRLADDVTRQTISALTKLLSYGKKMINIDIEHVKQVMNSKGGSIFLIGIGEGENKVIKAIQRATHHPFLPSINLESATNIIISFTGGADLTPLEINEAINYIHEEGGFVGDIIPAVTEDIQMKNKVQVILLVSGIGGIPFDIRRKDNRKEKKISEHASDIFNVLSFETDLDPLKYQNILNPYLQAIAEFQHIIDDLQNRPRELVKIKSIIYEDKGILSQPIIEEKDTPDYSECPLVSNPLPQRKSLKKGGIHD